MVLDLRLSKDWVVGMTILLFFILHTSGIYYDRYSKLQESTEYHQSGTGVVGGFLRGSIIICIPPQSEDLAFGANQPTLHTLAEISPIASLGFL